MQSQAHTLGDMCANLEENRDALLQTAVHADYMKDPSYRAFIQAANEIPMIVRLIPIHVEPFINATVLQQECMPSKGIVDRIRARCDEVTDLGHGNASPGIVGWRDCYKTLRGFVGG